MAILIRYQPSNLTREKYDKVNEILQREGSDQPPNELKIHVLFGDEASMRVSEIWEDEASWRQFYDGALGDALREAGVERMEPEILAIHELWGTGLANP